MSLDTIDAADLIALSIDRRFGRIADAAERTATNSERIAVALETLAGLMAGLSEIVPAERLGDPIRCTLRTHNATPLYLQSRASDEASNDED
jgi:hypothetical protein